MTDRDKLSAALDGLREIADSRYQRHGLSADEYARRLLKLLEEPTSTDRARLYGEVPPLSDAGWTKGAADKENTP